MSRIGRKPLPAPQGGDARPEAGLRQRQGAEGGAVEGRCPTASRIKTEADKILVSARRRLAREPRQARPRARAPRQHGQGRDRRLDARARDQRRRLPRRGRRRHHDHGARLLAPGRVQAAEGRHRQGRQEPDHAVERGPRPRRPDRGQGARAARPRALQGQGRQVRRGSRSNARSARPARPAAAKPRRTKNAHGRKQARKQSRKKRHRSLRKRIEGTAERPRLAVFRSTRHIYAQVIDDLDKKTLAAISDATLEAPRARPRRATATQPARRLAPSRSAPPSPRSASRRASTRSCSIARATSTTGGSRRSPTGRARRA